jgi:hypothetical protein
MKGVLESLMMSEQILSDFLNQDILKNFTRLRMETEDQEARKTLFWNRLRRNSDLNRNHLKIEDGVLYGSIDKISGHPDLPKLPESLEDTDFDALGPGEA